MNTNRLLVRAAQGISMICSPFYLSTLAFVAIFYFSYLNMLPFIYKASVTILVYLFTVALPQLSIYCYRRINGWTRHQMGRRERRYLPYLLSICSYSALLYVLLRLNMPRFTLGIIAGALAIQVIGSLLNPWIKVCTHSAAVGGVAGALLGFSLIFPFNPTGWLCLTVMLAGVVGSARLVLRQHTLSEVGIGCLVGVLCGFFFIVLI